MKNESVTEKKRTHKWVTWLYTLILVAVAVAGVLYCSKLRKDAEAAKQAAQVFANEDGTEILDIGDGSISVPLSDVTD